MQEQLLSSLLDPRLPPPALLYKAPFHLGASGKHNREQLLGRVQAWAWEICGEEPIAVNEMLLLASLSFCCCAGISLHQGSFGAAGTHSPGMLESQKGSDQIFMLS